jgi:hypothetical protein
VNCSYTIILKLILVCHCVQVISKDSNHFLVIWRVALIFRGYFIFIVAASFILNFTCRTAAIWLSYCIICSMLNYFVSLNPYLSEESRVRTRRKINPLRQERVPHRKHVIRWQWLAWQTECDYHYSTRLCSTHFAFVFIFIHCYSYSFDLLQN